MRVAEFILYFVLVLLLRELNASYTNFRTKIVALLRAVEPQESDFRQSAGFEVEQGNYKQ